MLMDDARTRPAVEHAPPTLWIIALVALAPFPVTALLYTYGPAEHAALALRGLFTWSMIVLAFLGGVRWGLETSRPVPRWGRLAASIVSPAAAWSLYLARAQLAPPWIIAGFLGAFLLQWLFDHRAPDAPARYPRLSTTMTGGACVSLAFALEKALHA